MRTSNKILLGIFIVPLLILTLIQVALYARYKSGSYVNMKKIEQDRFIQHALKNINHVAVYGLNNFRIVPSPAGRLEIEKQEDAHLHYTISGDTLLIHGDSMVTGPGQRLDILRSNQAVSLYLPGAVSVQADNSEVRLEGSKDSLRAQSYHFLLDSSTLKIEEHTYNETGYVYFNELSIHASHAPGIELTPNCRVAALQLTLTETEFNDNGALIDRLAVDADKASTITLKGVNLKKITGAQ